MFDSMLEWLEDNGIVVFPGAGNLDDYETFEEFEAATEGNFLGRMFESFEIHSVYDDPSDYECCECDD